MGPKPLHHAAEPADAAADDEGIKVVPLHGHGGKVRVLGDEHPAAHGALYTLDEQLLAQGDEEDLAVLEQGLVGVHQDGVAVHDEGLHGLAHDVEHDAFLRMDADAPEKVLPEGIESRGLATGVKGAARPGLGLHLGDHLKLHEVQPGLVQGDAEPVKDLAEFRHGGLARAVEPAAERDLLDAREFREPCCAPCPVAGRPQRPECRFHESFHAGYLPNG